MTRLKKLTLDGFKGIHAEDELKELVYLTGPNGSGKTARMDAIRLALRGGIGGRNLESVAAYFGPRGGSITLEDDEGNWIKRGIAVDADKGSLSEILEVSGVEGSGHREHQAAALDLWKAADVTLDLGAFLNLSADRRREFILDLCGGNNAVPTANLLSALEAEFCKELAGPGATAEILTRLADLPENLKAIGETYVARNGIRDTIKAHLLGAEIELVAALQKLTETAKNGRLSAASDAKESRAAARELAAGIEDIGDHEAKLASLIESVEAAREKVSVLREMKAKHDEAEKAHLRAVDRERKALDELDQARTALERIEREQAALSEMPDAPERESNAESLKDELAELDILIADREKRLRATERQTEAVKTLEIALERSKDAVESAVKSKPARLAALMREIPDDAHPHIPAVRELVQDVTDKAEADIRERTDQLNADCDKLYVAKQALADLPDLAAIEKETAALRQERLSKAKALDQSRADAFEAERIKAKAGQSKAKAEVALESAKQALASAREEKATTGARLAMASVSDPELSEARTELSDLERQKAEAEKYAGAIRELSAAKERATGLGVAHDAWKMVEAAIKTVRERMIGETTEPLLHDVDQFLAAVGRPERVCLQLEASTGRPVFNLGWAREDGHVTDLSVLSGGEAVIMCAALSVAVTMRLQGRRVLMVEAGECDRDNLESLLYGLESVNLDAIGNMILASPVKIDASEIHTLELGV